jgi:hypothetical protein
MTEAQLLEYVKYNNKIKKLVEEYRECGEMLACPKSPNLKSIPGGGENDEKLLKLIDRRQVLEKKIEECAVLRELADKRLDKVSELLLSDVHVKVFDKLYRIGLSVKDTAKELNYCYGNVYRIRNCILDLVKDL